MEKTSLSLTILKSKILPTSLPSYRSYNTVFGAIATLIVYIAVAIYFTYNIFQIFTLSNTTVNVVQFNKGSNIDSDPIHLQDRNFMFAFQVS